MSATSLKVLVIGSGGREHAIVKACKSSPLVAEVIAAPGNGGIRQDAACYPLELLDPEACLSLASNLKASLVVIGPEVPLCAGVADHLREHGFAVYGPGRDAAQLEGSKLFAKNFMLKYGIPTAKAELFTASQLDAAIDYVRQQDYPLVVKASGLAAGKGVIITEDISEAEATVESMLSGGRFGPSGEEIVIEECLDGPEVSIMLMVCNGEYVMLPPSQDHKRIGDGDTGPNTGGMGAYAPALVLTPEVEEEVRKTIIQPSLDGLQAEGLDYRGTLYIGLMLTHDGPKVLEYNVRFGDPECQILLPLLQSDPLRLMWECAQGKLQSESVHFRNAHAMIVVLASHGYPGAFPKGEKIEFPDVLPENTQLIHAGTALDPDGSIVTSGGRVLGAVGLGSTFLEARNNAYSLAQKLCWPSVTYRKDIGWRQLEQ